MDFAYDPLEEDESFNREYVVHADGEYADDTTHVNTYESHRHASETAVTGPLRPISTQTHLAESSVSDTADAVSLSSSTQQP